MVFPISYDEVGIDSSRRLFFNYRNIVGKLYMPPSPLALFHDFIFIYFLAFDFCRFCVTWNNAYIFTVCFYRLYCVEWELMNNWLATQGTETDSSKHVYIQGSWKWETSLSWYNSLMRLNYLHRQWSIASPLLVTHNSFKVIFSWRLEYLRGKVVGVGIFKKQSCRSRNT